MPCAASHGMDASEARADRLRKPGVTPERLSEVHEEHLARTRTVGSKRLGPFRRFSRAASSAVGKPWAFALAAFTVVAWAALGPIFHYSDTWQLVINTSTTIVTFLMVFLIQNTQNRDTEALRLKLDELILATRAARNEFVDLDDLEDEELQQLEHDVRHLAQQGDPDPEPKPSPLPRISRPRTVS
jgi:low affinity Fe/Cu permease